MNVRLQEDFMNQFKRTEDMVVFLYLLLHADDEGKIETSISKLCSELGYTEKTIRTSLSGIERANQVANQVANRKRLITICNAESYMVRKKGKGQTFGQTFGQQKGKPPEGAELSREERFIMRMAEVYPNVAKLEQPLTLDQYNKYLETYDNETIKETLLAMDNCKELSKKYISANLTLGNWLRRRDS